MIKYLTLLLAIPTGIILSILTKKEREIFTRPQYFPTLVWILAILSAIFLTINEQIAFPLIFSTITVFTWMKFKPKIKHNKK